MGISIMDDGCTRGTTCRVKRLVQRNLANSDFILIAFENNCYLHQNSHLKVLMYVNKHGSFQRPRLPHNNRRLLDN